MKERLVELLILIMAEIQEKTRLSEIDLGRLKSKGYTASEISAAFSWLYENFPVHDGVMEHPGRPSTGSRRVLHEAERAMLSVEAQGYLVQLYELGLLDTRDLENVIERAMMTGYERFSMDELSEIVAAVLFSKQGGEGGTHRSLGNNKDSIH